MNTAITFEISDFQFYLCGSFEKIPGAVQKRPPGNMNTAFTFLIVKRIKVLGSALCNADVMLL